MFDDPPPLDRRFLALGIAAIVAAVIAAGGVAVWLVFETRKEQEAIREVLREGSREVARDIGSLPGELRWQLAFSVLMVVVLVVVAVVVIRLAWALFRSEASLQAVRLQSWNVLASMDHAVITTDCEGRITSMNPRGQDLLATDSDAQGQLLEAVCPPDLGLAGLSRKVLDTFRPMHDEEHEVVLAGQRHRFRLDCHLLNDPRNEVLGTVIHVRDVTDRALMQQRMQRMERFMGLGNLAAGLHHEIKNPLSALSLHVQLLEEHFDGIADAEVAEGLAVLKSEVARISGVLESFREYASVTKLTLTPVALTDVIERTLRLLRPKAERHDVLVHWKAPSAPVPPVMGDPAKLEQVLLNLALNAIDAMRDGGTLTIRLSSLGQGAIVEVADTGPGIPANIASQVFDPYFTTKNEGSGMGLALCDKIVQQHGGEITFSSSPEGAVFRLRLPRKEDP